MLRTTLKCFEFSTGLGAAKVGAAPAAQVWSQFLNRLFAIFIFTTRKNTSIDDHEEMNKCLDFQDHGLFFLGIQQNLLWLFLLLLIWDDGAAADNKTRHFVFLSPSSCWLLHGNSVWCGLFVFWPWIGRRTNYDLKTTFRIGSTRFEWWCRWWLIGFIFRSCFPLNKTKYIVYHDKKIEHYSFHSFKNFQSKPTIFMDSLCVFILFLCSLCILVDFANIWFLK